MAFRVIEPAGGGEQKRRGFRVIEPAPERKQGFGARVGGAFNAAVENVKREAGAAPQVGRSSNGLGSLVNVIASPVNEAVEAGVVEPVANLLSQVPAQAYGPNTLAGRGKPLNAAETNEMWKGGVRKGLMAVGPKAPGQRALFGPRPGPPAPAKPNMLADTVAAFDRAGVTPDLATASKGGGASRVANAIAENPVAGIASRGRMRARVGEVEASADRIGSQYGTSTSRGAAGERVQGGVKGYNERFSQRAEQLYDDAFGRLDADMAGKTQPGASRIRTSHTSNVLDQMLNGVQSQSLRALLADPNVQRVADSLMGARGAADLSFNDLRSLRTWVRNAKGNPELRQSIGEANLRRLEGSLTEDIYANAAALATPEAAAKLQRVDKWYRLGSERIDGALQNFVGRGAYPKSGESTYDLIMRAAGDKGGADFGRLSALRKSLQPDEWGEVAATTVNRMGAPTPGAAEAGEFSISRFVTNYNTMSEQGRNLLFGTGATRKELDNLAKVAGMVKRVEKGANTSNSGSSLQALGTIGGLVNPATAIPTAKVLAGLTLTGEAMTNPVVVRWLAKVGSAQTPAQMRVVVRQLSLAAQKNRALLPLSQQTALLLEAPKVATRATASTEPQQDR